MGDALGAARAIVGRTERVRAHIRRERAPPASPGVAGAPVVPITLRGTNKVMPHRQGLLALFCSEVHITIHKVIGHEGEEVEEPERADPAIGSRTNGATSIAWCGYGSAFVIERSSSAPDSSDGLGRLAGAT